MIKTRDNTLCVGVILATLLDAGCAGLPADSGREEPGQTVHAFTDVTVVPMAGEGLVPHQTVLVRGTIIEAIGPAEGMTVPPSAVVIAGRGRSEEFGTVEVGKRADPIPTEANPLEDVGTIRDHAGVMVRGRWIPRETLERMEEEQ